MKVKLTITSEIDFSQIKVYDHSLELVAEGLNMLEHHLSPGIYRFEVNAHDKRYTRLFQITAEQDKYLSVSQSDLGILDSVIPFEGTNKAEFAEKISRNAIAVIETPNEDSFNHGQLFIFINTNTAYNDYVRLNGIKLASKTDELIYDFNPMWQNVWHLFLGYQRSL